jgi:hypothetical protein
MDTDPRAHRQQSGTPEDPAPDSFYGLNLHQRKPASPSDPPILKPPASQS